MSALLEVRGVVRDHRMPRRRFLGPAPVVRSLDGVDLSVEQGSAVGVIGESGSGKSSLARILVGLDLPTEGEVLIDGASVVGDRERQRALRRATGVLFQDPALSLDPRMRVGDAVAEPLLGLRRAGLGPAAADDAATVAAVLARVGLPADAAARYPHAFSGGQRQRIALARAIVHRPRILVADEPLSAQDAALRSSMLELFVDLRRDLDLTLIAVSHDIGIVAALCDRVAVMRDGRIVEEGTVSRILRAPEHAYTAELLAAVPRLPED
jgi:ABC-type glutathione transport system ATPase component